MLLKRLLPLLLLSLATSCFSQSMLEPGLHWSVGKWSWSLFSTQQYRIGQDTMINSTSYKTLDTRWWPTDDWALDGAMREDHGVMG